MPAGSGREVVGQRLTGRGHALNVLVATVVTFAGVLLGLGPFFPFVLMVGWVVPLIGSASASAAVDRVLRDEPSGRQHVIGHTLAGFVCSLVVGVLAATVLQWPPAVFGSVVGGTVGALLGIIAARALPGGLRVAPTE